MTTVMQRLERLRAALEEIEFVTASPPTPYGSNALRAYIRSADDIYEIAGLALREDDKLARADGQDGPNAVRPPRRSLDLPSRETA